MDYREVMQVLSQCGLGAVLLAAGDEILSANDAADRMLHGHGKLAGKSLCTIAAELCTPEGGRQYANVTFGEYLRRCPEPDVNGLPEGCRLVVFRDATNDACHDVMLDALNHVSEAMVICDAHSRIWLLNEAAEDENVISIKMTLYRLAKQSKVVEALIEAAENGKEVVVLVELRARFDEENNIEWSRRLEEAGCQVIYGLEGYKVHSKLCLITRKTEGQVEYITQIGTGNYNEKTSRLYTDLSLMTANVDIGLEASAVFQALSKGEVVEKSDKLLVAPKCLQNRVLDMIDEEIRLAQSGEEAYIGLKLNSLTDKKIIDKLIEASCAGVKIDMIIRGIACIIPGVEGSTENIRIISIVGRFLEHSRIYIFGRGERAKYYIASADFMTRNTVRRVEVAAPVLQENLKERLQMIFDTMLHDNQKAREACSDGDYRHVVPQSGEELLNSQEYFYQEAYEKAGKV